MTWKIVVSYLSDEIFAIDAPILLTIDAKSTAILKRELASDHSAETWKVHFAELDDHLFHSRRIGIVHEGAAFTPPYETVATLFRENSKHFLHHSPQEPGGVRRGRQGRHAGQGEAHWRRRPCGHTGAPSCLAARDAAGSERRLSRCEIDSHSSGQASTFFKEYGRFL